MLQRLFKLLRSIWVSRSVRQLLTRCSPWLKSNALVPVSMLPSWPSMTIIMYIWNPFSAFFLTLCRKTWLLKQQSRSWKVSSQARSPNLVPSLEERHVNLSEGLLLWQRNLPAPAMEFGRICKLEYTLIETLYWYTFDILKLCEPLVESSLGLLLWLVTKHFVLVLVHHHVKVLFLLVFLW